jgi:hypothetical protein
MYAPDQHDLYDGHFVISAGRVSVVGSLNDPPGWNHMDNGAVATTTGRRRSSFSPAGDLGHATLNGKPLYQDYEMHFIVTQGIRDRKTLRVNYPQPDKKGPAGEVNPATQQLDFYIRSPKTDPRNTPNREVFAHFFAMEVTWK